MFRAIRSGNVEKLEQSLGEGANPNRIHFFNTQDWMGIGLVLHLVHTGVHDLTLGRQMIELLIKHNAVVTFENINDVVANNNPGLFSALVRHSKEARRLGESQEILCKAVCHGSLEILQEIKLLYGNTFKLPNGLIGLVKELNHYPHNARTIDALDFVINSGGYSLEDTDFNGSTLLHLAGSAEMTQYFLKKGFDPNIRNKYQVTPLFYANSPEQINTLLEAGADPTVVDWSGRGAIWTMVAKGVSIEVIAHAIEMGISYSGEKINSTMSKESYDDERTQKIQEAHIVIQTHKKRVSLTEKAGLSRKDPTIRKPPRM